MNPNYQQALSLGIEICNKFPYGSELYQKGEKIIAWACERNRQEQKVELSYPPVIGSLDEKMNSQADEIALEN